MNEENKIEFNKVRNFGETLNATFNFIGQNFKKFLKSFIFIAGPFLLIQTIVQVYAYSNLYGNTRTGVVDFSIFGKLLLVYPFTILSLVFIQLVTYNYIILYKKYGKDGFTINDLWLACRRNFWRLLGISFLVGLMTGAATLLIIVPGIYVFIASSLAPFILLYEDISVGDAIGRSFNLIKGKWWFTAGILLVVYIVQVMFSYALMIPTMIATFVFGAHNIESDPTAPAAFLNGLMVIMSVLQNLTEFIYTFAMVALAFVYFSILERKEAKGLNDRLDKMLEGEGESSAGL